MTKLQKTNAPYNAFVRRYLWSITGLISLLFVLYVALSCTLTMIFNIAVRHNHGGSYAIYPVALRIASLAAHMGANTREFLTMHRKTAFELCTDGAPRRIVDGVDKPLTVNFSLSWGRLCAPSHSWDTEFYDAQSYRSVAILIAAISTGQDLSTTKDLISWGIDVNQHDTAGRTPLRVTSCMGQVDVLDILIQNGLFLTQEEVMDSLECATIQNHPAMVIRLLKSGVDVKTATRSDHDYSEPYNRMLIPAGSNLLHIACYFSVFLKTGYDSIVKTGYGETVRALIATGVDPDQKNSAGLSPREICPSI